MKLLNLPFHVDRPGMQWLQCESTLSWVLVTKDGERHGVQTLAWLTQESRLQHPNLHILRLHGEETLLQEARIFEHLLTVHPFHAVLQTSVPARRLLIYLHSKVPILVALQLLWGEVATIGSKFLQTLLFLAYQGNPGQLDGLLSFWLWSRQNLYLSISKPTWTWGHWWPVSCCHASKLCV